MSTYPIQIPDEVKSSVASYDWAAAYEKNRPGLWSECAVERRDYASRPWRIVHVPSVTTYQMHFSADPAAVHRTGGELGRPVVFEHWALGETVITEPLCFRTKREALQLLAALQERFPRPPSMKSDAQ